MTTLFDPGQLDTLSEDDLRSILRELAAADETGDEIPWSGVICAENSETGDGRFIVAGALEWRDLPLPLMLQTITAPGHDGAIICGRIETIKRDGDLIVATGMLADIPAGHEAAQLIAENLITGVSVDMDGVEGYLDDDAERFVYEKGRIMGATLTPFPAFAEAQVGLVAAAGQAPTKIWSAANISIDPAALVATAGTKTKTIPIRPPAAWFSYEAIDQQRPYPTRIEEDGRVHGYVAEWRSCHIGYRNVCKTPPHSTPGYPKFRTGNVLTDEGMIQTGRIICKTAHPDLALNASDTEVWYHDTGCTVGDVVAGEDEHGIWIAGAIRPGADENLIREVRGADMSPDWRPVNGKNEMIAVLACGVSGFIGENPLALVASAGTPTHGPRFLEHEHGFAATGLGMLHHDPNMHQLRTDMDRLANSIEILRPVIASLLHAQATGQETLTVMPGVAKACACRKDH